MMAVKQVEMPQTSSDKDNEAQKTNLEALKFEIETLKDLDHPNIVQYLGFEETAEFLSIFLEYVPGGSVGRCVRHSNVGLSAGKLEEVWTLRSLGDIACSLPKLLVFQKTET